MHHFSKIRFATSILNTNSKLKPQIKTLKLRSQKIIENLAKGMIEKTFLSAVQEKDKKSLANICDFLKKDQALKTKVFSYKDKQGNGLLHLAVDLQDFRIVEILLNYEPKACYSQNKNGDTPLHLAVDLPDSRIAELLLNYGPKACYSQNKNGDTPLHLAICHKDIALSQKLIDTKPDTGLSQNEDGNTPLHLALELEGEEALGLIEKILSKCSDSIFPKNLDGQTALHLITADMPEAEAKRLLLYSAWHQAVNDLFENLLEQRSDPTSTYSSRTTALRNFGQEISYQFKKDDSKFDITANYILNMFSSSFKKNILNLKIDTFSNHSHGETLRCPLSLQEFKVTDTNQSLYYLIPFNLLFCFKLPEDQIMLDVFTQESTWLREPFHPDLFIKVSPERTAEG